MKAVVFDMDGVLFDTERLCEEVWSQIATKHHISGMKAVMQQCIGLNENDTRTLVKKHFGQDFPYDDLRNEVSECFWNKIEKDGLPIKMGVQEILSYLQQEGYGIGLASSSKRESVLHHLQQAGIINYFSAIITGDMVEHSKPEPDIYLKACEELKVEPARAYAIEDAPNGIRSAYAAGMKPIMVPDRIKPDAEMEQYSYCICENLIEVMECLDR